MVRGKVNYYKWLASGDDEARSEIVVAELTLLKSRASSTTTGGSSLAMMKQSSKL
jgi:hypothetical protein